MHINMNNFQNIATIIEKEQINKSCQCAPSLRTQQVSITSQQVHKSVRLKYLLSAHGKRRNEATNLSFVKLITFLSMFRCHRNIAISDMIEVCRSSILPRVSIMRASLSALPFTHTLQWGAALNTKNPGDWWRHGKRVRGATTHAVWIITSRWWLHRMVNKRWRRARCCSQAHELFL